MTENTIYTTYLRKLEVTTADNINDIYSTINMLEIKTK